MKMNRLQCVILAIGIAAVVFVRFIYPPWTEFYRDDEGRIMRKDHGHAWIWNKPARVASGKSEGTIVATSKVYPFVAVIALLTWGAYAAAGRKQGPAGTTDEPGSS